MGVRDLTKIVTQNPLRFFADITLLVLSTIVYTVASMHHSVITDSLAETYCGKIITLPSNDWDELFSDGCHGEPMVCWCAQENFTEEICPWLA